MEYQIFSDQKDQNTFIVPLDRFVFAGTQVYEPLNLDKISKYCSSEDTIKQKKKKSTSDDTLSTSKSKKLKHSKDVEDDYIKKNIQEKTKDYNESNITHTLNDCETKENGNIKQSNFDNSITIENRDSIDIANAIERPLTTTKRSRGNRGGAKLKARRLIKDARERGETPDPEMYKILKGSGQQNKVNQPTSIIVDKTVVKEISVETSKTIKTAEKDKTDKKISEVDITKKKQNQVYLDDLASSSSSSASSSHSEEEGIPAYDILLPGDAEETTELSTSRLALQDLNWDIVTAEDIFRLVSQTIEEKVTGKLKKVEIVTSKFGTEQLEKESSEGPQIPAINDGVILGYQANLSGTSSKDESELYSRLRRRYYFAVLHFSDEATSDIAYNKLNGLSLMNGDILDLRVIPDEIKFDTKVRESAKSAEPLSGAFDPFAEMTKTRTVEEEQRTRMILNREAAMATARMTLDSEAVDEFGMYTGKAAKSSHGSGKDGKFRKIVKQGYSGLSAVDDLLSGPLREILASPSEDEDEDWVKEMLKDTNAGNVSSNSEVSEDELDTKSLGTKIKTKVNDIDQKFKTNSSSEESEDESDSEDSDDLDSDTDDDSEDSDNSDSDSDIESIEEIPKMKNDHKFSKTDIKKIGGTKSELSEDKDNKSGNMNKKKKISKRFDCSDSESENLSKIKEIKLTPQMKIIKKYSKLNLTESDADRILSLGPVQRSIEIYKLKEKERKRRSRKAKTDALETRKKLMETAAIEQSKERRRKRKEIRAAEKSGYVGDSDDSDFDMRKTVKASSKGLKIKNDNFKFNEKDSRLESILDGGEFAIDPHHSKYKPTEAIKQFQELGVKVRKSKRS